MKQFVFVLFFLCFVASSAQAANHYVRAGATGAADGSDWTNAYTALPAGLTRGDIYYIADGTYPGLTLNTAASGTTPITIKKATIADHGTSIGWLNTFTGAQAVFTDTVAFTTPYWVFDGQVGGGPGSWTTGHGFKISSGNNWGSIVRGDSTNSGANVTLRHVEVFGNGGTTVGNDCLSQFVTSNNTFEYLWVYGCGRTVMWAGGGVSNHIFQYNYTGKFHSEATSHAEICSCTVNTGITFRYNLFTHVEGTGGLMMDTGTSGNAAIYGNVFYEGLSGAWVGNNGAIGGWTGAGGEQFRNVSVYNNTFLNVTIPVLGGLPTTFSGNVAQNNLFYTVSNPGGGAVWDTISYNHFIATSTIGTNTSTGSGDPFVNYLALDFRLTAATTAGLTLAAPYTTDMLGITRGADGTWDRGALEFAGTTVIIPAPPTNLTVI